MRKIDTNILRKIVLIASFRRSGTHLAIDFLINNSSSVSTRLLTLDQLAKNHNRHLTPDQLVSKIIRNQKHNKYTIIKTHQPDPVYSFSQNGSILFKEILKHSKKAYIVRDGRDVMISLWHYLKTFHQNYRNDEITFSNHLNKYAPQWMQHIQYWKNRPDINILKYEDWFTNYTQTFQNLINYLEISFDSPIHNIIGKFKSDIRYSNRVPTIVKRIMMKIPLGKIRLTAVEPRLGSKGEWKTIFTDNDKILFKKLTGGTLIDLGYEDDSNW